MNPNLYLISQYQPLWLWLGSQHLFVITNRVREVRVAGAWHRSRGTGHSQPPPCQHRAQGGARGLDLHHGGDRSSLEGLSSPLEGLIPFGRADPPLEGLISPLEGLHVLLTLQNGKWVLLWRAKYIS